MIDKKVAAALADRFSGLNWYPREGPAQIELIQAVEIAENEFIGTYVVNEWIKYEPECPKPSEIRHLIHVENQKLRAERDQEVEHQRSQRATCPRCHGFGIKESIRGAPVESVCSYCSCEAGRRRAGREKHDPTKYPLEEYSEVKPEEVDLARQKLLKLSGKNAALVAMFRRTNREKPAFLDDGYSGEF